MDNVRAVILDWAGTTIDYGCFAPVKAFIESFESYGLFPTIEETREPMGMLKWEHIRTMLGMKRISAEFIKKYDRPFNDSDVDNIHDDFQDRLMRVLAKYTEPKPYVIETVEEIRKRGVKIGSTTGYTEDMMRVVIAEAKNKGYQPDLHICADAVDGNGRPYPYMIFRNMERLGVGSVDAVIKVGDTVSDILEGKNAGVLSVGIIEGSSVMGYTKEEYEMLSEAEREKECRRVKSIYEAVGADYVVRDIRGVVDIIDDIWM